MTPNTVKISLKSLLLTSIVGWIVSLYTLWHRAKVQAGMDLGQSFCNINSSINCDAVALSSYSHMFGLAVSTWGMIYFVLFALLCIRGLGLSTSGTFGKDDAKIIFFASGAGVVASIGLAIISLTKIGHFCIVCGVVYLLSFSLFYFSLKTFKNSSPSTKCEKMKPSFFIAAIVLIAAQVLFESLVGFAAKQTEKPYESTLPAEFINQVVSEYMSGPQYEISEQKSAVDGPATAPITIVEFSDFECPHCAQNHKTMPETLRPFGDKVKVIYKNYPLDPSCNSAGMHMKACFAARAARCVFKTKGLESFKKMQHYLFTERESFSRESTQKEAISLGLSESEYTSCVESPDVYQEIKDEIDLGKSLGVDSTPSVYLNGRKLKSGTSSDILGAVINKLLEEKK